MSKADALLKKAESFEKLAVYTDRKSFFQSLKQDNSMGSFADGTWGGGLSGTWGGSDGKVHLNPSVNVEGKKVSLDDAKKAVEIIPQIPGKVKDVYNQITDPNYDFKHMTDADRQADQARLQTAIPGFKGTIPNFKPVGPLATDTAPASQPATPSVGYAPSGIRPNIWGNSSYMHAPAQPPQQVAQNQPKPAAQPQVAQNQPKPAAQPQTPQPPVKPASIFDYLIKKYG